MITTPRAVRVKKDCGRSLRDAEGIRFWSWSFFRITSCHSSFLGFCFSRGLSFGVQILFIVILKSHVAQILWIPWRTPLYSPLCTCTYLPQLSNTTNNPGIMTKSFPLCITDSTGNKAQYIFALWSYFSHLIPMKIDKVYNLRRVN